MKQLMTKDGLFFTVESDIQHDAFLAGGWSDVKEQPSAKASVKDEAEKTAPKKTAKKKQ